MEPFASQTPAPGDTGAAPTIGAQPQAAAGRPPKPPGTQKRTLTPAIAFKTVCDVIVSSPVIARALIKPGIPAALREKILLGVTSITDCRYCQWGHSHWARAHGVPLEEINQILESQIESLQARDPAEAAAILFAQHYAENLDQFDRKALDGLRQFYSDGQVAEILAYVRTITLASLTGNALDGLLGRLRRAPARNHPP